MELKPIFGFKYQVFKTRFVAVHYFLFSSIAFRIFKWQMQGLEKFFKP